MNLKQMIRIVQGSYKNLDLPFFSRVSYLKLHTQAPTQINKYFKYTGQFKQYAHGVVHG